MKYEQVTLPSGLLITRVSGTLWRVAQPKTLEDCKVMYDSLGIRTRVKLNTEKEGSDNCVRAAAIVVHDCAIEPIADGDLLDEVVGIFEKPDPVKVELALQLMDGDNVVVGCQHNHDRTSLLVGMRRVRYEGWSVSDAWDEMLLFGYHPELVGLDRSWWDENAAGRAP
jgi:hypothetical protein